jgi:hypothetical protein
MFLRKYLHINAKIFSIGVKSSENILKKVVVQPKPFG